jgi:dCMP deaminase
MSYGEIAADSDYANCIATHAERNAIEHADPYELAGATLYVTRKPCPACQTLIEASGIKKTIYREESTQCSPQAGPLRSMLQAAVNSRA